MINRKSKIKSRKSKRGCVLVIGAGIAGATVAERLSRAGKEVCLIDKYATIGGHVAEMGCKATDVCLRCGVCVAHDVLRTVAASPSIHIHTRTQLSSLSPSTNGSRYTAQLSHQPTFVDRTKCIGCQACVRACPENAIVGPKLEVAPAVPMIDYSLCRRSYGKKCSACEQVCPVEAINMQDKFSQTKIDVDAVVIAVGYDPYDPREEACYGYGKTANVITGIEAERQLATKAKITRPCDGQPPKRIAFIQCVGSRDEQVHRCPQVCDYCSTVCCAYSLRMAQLMKYQNQDAQVTIFYMDIQNVGPGFNEFYNKCKDTMSFIRARPCEIKQGSDGAVRVKFTLGPGEVRSLEFAVPSTVCEQEFDLVILAVGIRPKQDAAQLAETLLVPLDEQGFFGLKGASSQPALQREGIFVAGACESPKDIQSCMAQAEAVSALIVSSSWLVVHS